jgi:hypothetical membrane protein
MVVPGHKEEGEPTMGVRRAGKLSDYRLERRHVLATLAITGIAGPIVFVVFIGAQSLVHPDYSQVKLPISALAAWPGGWVQDANFVLFGLLTILFAIGLHLGVRRNRAAVIGPGLLMLSGVGLIIAGFFPWRSVDGDFVVPAGYLLGAPLSFLGAGAGFIVLLRRVAADPRWHGVGPYALGSGIAIVASFVATFALVIPPSAPLHSWGGLMQRATLAVWFPCTVVLALRLLRVAKATGATR